MLPATVNLSNRANTFATKMYKDSGTRRDMPQTRYRVIEPNMGFMHGVNVLKRNPESLYIISEFTGRPVVEVTNSGQAFYVRDNFTRECVIQNELFLTPEILS